MGLFNIARRFDRLESIPYVLGHSELEMERLQLQASIIEGVTRRLIQESGIGTGMTVLEIGCGAGDVSILLAEAVGGTWAGGGLRSGSACGRDGPSEGPLNGSRQH
jgi:ubiquinone/menaquinone biosynthesis C-methylase UbiE